MATRTVTGVIDLAGSYTGLVASLCDYPDSFQSGIKNIQSRSPHYARDAITSLRVLFPNFNGIQEVANGATATIAATIEYPVGTYTRITFSASNTGTIPNGGSLLSDAVSVTIPKGGLFYVRSNFNCSAGACYSAFFANSVIGAGCETGGTVGSLTDKTTSGTLNTVQNAYYVPLAIVGTTNKPSFCFLGDSITDGFKDSFDDQSGDVGVVARSLGPSFGYSNFGMSGEGSNAFLAGNANRSLAIAYATDLTLLYGTNDLGGGSTASQIQGFITSIAALYPTKRIWLFTVPPRTTSTDSWATTTNQTVASSESNRLSLNRFLRACPAGFANVLDLADVLESTHDSGKWAVPYTPDGIHPNLAGNVLVKNSRLIRPEMFLR